MLEMRHVTKIFNPGTVDEKIALNDLSFTLNDGDFVTVIGGNGAGKSTMQNAICGTWLPDAGEILLDGIDLSSLSEHQRAKYLGRVYQDPMTGTAAGMQIEENLALAARRGLRRTLRPGIRKSEREEYRQRLQELGLGLDTRLSAKVGTLSGGQRQALTLLMATLRKPKLLLLDEHTAALDPKTAAKVMKLTERMVTEEKLSTLMITHNMRDAIRYGKTVSAEYTYAGYQPKLDDEGKIRSVRYQFETTSADAPKYVQFNDHGHEPGEAEHFHIYFGNDGFDALMSGKTNPFFVKDALSAEDILDELMGHDHGEEKDEHVWLSLKNAQTLCVTLADALCAIDPDNKNTYIANAAAYRDKLAALDADYKAAVEGATHKTVLFGDRFPFRYLVDDYGLRYYAAFAGCSAETEASFETVSFLAKKVDELGLPCVLTIEGAQHRIAETIVQNTAGKKQKVLTMDSMQSTTSKDVASGATYLSVMEKNLSVLKEALG